MTPELRAIADRFIYEQATLKHMATMAPKEALDRNLAGQPRTVRQLLAHLAGSFGEFDGVLKKWLAGEPPFEGWDPDQINAQSDAAHAETRVDALVGIFGAGLDGLIATLAQIPDERLEEQLGPAEALSTLKMFAGHTLDHAIELVEAVPEIRYDPLVLNWLLSATFSSAEADAWQERLLGDARAYIAAHQDEFEDEEDEE